jgi:hypothetical protein
VAKWAIMARILFSRTGRARPAADLANDRGLGGGTDRRGRCPIHTAVDIRLYHFSVDNCGLVAGHVAVCRGFRPGFRLVRGSMAGRWPRFVGVWRGLPFFLTLRCGTGHRLGAITGTSSGRRSLIFHRSSLAPLALRERAFSRHYTTNLNCCKHVLILFVRPPPQVLAPQRFAPPDICSRFRACLDRRGYATNGASPSRQRSWGFPGEPSAGGQENGLAEKSFAALSSHSLPRHRARRGRNSVPYAAYCGDWDQEQERSKRGRSFVRRGRRPGPGDWVQRSAERSGLEFMPRSE